jgi:hypothetical protein
VDANRKAELLACNHELAAELDEALAAEKLARAESVSARATYMAAWQAARQASRRALRARTRAVREARGALE